VAPFLLWGLVKTGMAVAVGRVLARARLMPANA
jgi:hypothetical protein